LVWRAAITLLGSAVVAIGIAMIVLPGPGWAVIFLGLAILATEYVWAHRLLVTTRSKVGQAAARATDPAVRTRNIAIAVIGALIVAAVLTWYLWAYGFTFDGYRDLTATGTRVR
jgi:uncharacterized protein (TIGR02611 family)